MVNKNTFGVQKSVFENISAYTFLSTMDTTTNQSTRTKMNLEISTDQEKGFILNHGILD